MEYKIISAKSVEILETHVNELTKDGWKPVGGVTIEDNTTEEAKKSKEHEDIDICYYQVVVK